MDLRKIIKYNKEVYLLPTKGLEILTRRNCNADWCQVRLGSSPSACIYLGLRQSYQSIFMFSSDLNEFCIQYVVFCYIFHVQMQKFLSVCKRYIINFKSISGSPENLLKKSYIVIFENKLQRVAKS
jgi:hypothetical protein